jgi:hypothetical protein
MAADIFTFCPRPLPTPERGRTSRALRELDEWRSRYAELLARYSRLQLTVAQLPAVAHPREI